MVQMNSVEKYVKSRDVEILFMFFYMSTFIKIQRNYKNDLSLKSISMSKG